MQIAWQLQFCSCSSSQRVRQNTYTLCCFLFVKIIYADYSIRLASVGHLLYRKTLSSWSFCLNDDLSLVLPSNMNHQEGAWGRTRHQPSSRCFWAPICISSGMVSMFTLQPIIFCNRWHHCCQDLSYYNITTSINL